MGQASRSSGCEPVPSYSHLKVQLGTDLLAHSISAGWDSNSVPCELMSGFPSVAGHNGIATGLLPTWQLEL